MESLPRRSQHRPKVVPFTRRTAAADDLAIARRRMRHLAPWHVEPLPAMHSVIGGPGEPLSVDQREHDRELGLQMLAIHMWLASAQSAMH
jgi:hypothetical protein